MAGRIFVTASILINSPSIHKFTLICAVTPKVLPATSADLPQCEQEEPGVLALGSVMLFLLSLSQGWRMKRARKAEGPRSPSQDRVPVLDVQGHFWNTCSNTFIGFFSFPSPLPSLKVPQPAAPTRLSSIFWGLEGTEFRNRSHLLSNSAWINDNWRNTVMRVFSSHPVNICYGPVWRYLIWNLAGARRGASRL